MKMKKMYPILYLLFVSGCQHTVGQEKAGGDITMVLDEKVVFVDEGVETLIKGHVLAYVTFKDSLTLKPIDASIRMIKMKSKGSVEVDFIFAHPKEVNLSNYEKSLLEKYWPILASIYMDSRYEFMGDKKWIYGRRMAMSFPFEIKPVKENR